MREITKAQEDLLKALWEIKEGAISDVLDSLDEPKPAYNTVSTIIRILEKKGFVDHKAYGTTYEYFPIVKKEDYANFHFSDFMKNYFNDSFPRMAAFFARENNLSMEDMEEIMRLTEIELKKMKSGSKK